MLTRRPLRRKRLESNAERIRRIGTLVGGSHVICKVDGAKVIEETIYYRGRNVVVCTVDGFGEASGWHYAGNVTARKRALKKAMQYTKDPVELLKMQAMISEL